MSDIADRSDAFCEQIIAGGLAKHRLRAEREAREQPNHGGLCRECGEPVEAMRLAFNPRARRCVSCQTDFEKYGDK